MSASTQDLVDKRCVPCEGGVRGLEGLLGPTLGVGGGAPSPMTRSGSLVLEPRRRPSSWTS